jgi:alpha-methylacyl-CoA racemase
MTGSPGGGPLAGLRVLEFAGIGPGPFCAMLLADLGADVLRIDRADAVRGTRPERPPLDLLARGRRSVGLDLKRPEGVECALKLVERADVLLEGFRPGVMERLGLGPDVCLQRNEGLVYGRMTGFGQEGPLAQSAGHDINYIALAGALEPIGRKGEPPLAPLNLVGDFGGGGMLLAYGVMAALFERQRSGRGQVVDAAMVDGAATLMTLFHGMRHAGIWSDERGANLLDTGAPFYDVYETADGKYVSIGSLEPQFYAELLTRLEIDPATLPRQMDRSGWPELRRILTEKFRSRTRDEWCALLEGTDICFAPVLGIADAYAHPHNVARGTFVEVAGVRQPGPAPRFSRTPGRIARPPAHAGEHADEALGEWGFSGPELAELRERKALA